MKKNKMKKLLSAKKQHIILIDGIDNVEGGVYELYTKWSNRVMLY